MALIIGEVVEYRESPHEGALVGTIRHRRHNQARKRAEYYVVFAPGSGQSGMGLWLPRDVLTHAILPAPTEDPEALEEWLTTD